MNYSVENLSNEALKQLVKDTRQFKNQLYWRAWRELSNRYNMGEI